jgi:uncharacterized membrane protein
MKTSSKSRSAAPSTRYGLDAHHRVLTAGLVGAVTFVACHGRASFPNQLVMAWAAFAFTLVTLAWAVICTKDPYESRRESGLQDASVTFLFVLVISAAAASLVAVGLLLGSVKNLSPPGLAVHITLSVAAVVLSWWLVHTIFTLRYAHLYFLDARKVERSAISGGLLFPGKGSPNYLDFAYFSFVVGMTCQVSDVQVCSTKMRGLVLVHGLISFAFNTAILAMFVNIIAGLV